MMNRPSKHHRVGQGFSLIELMISITLGLMLLAAVSVLMSQQSTQRTEIDRAGRQIENGRYAMSIIQDDIQLAGYYGQFGMPNTPVTAVPNPCLVGNAADLPAITTALSTPIQVYDSLASIPAPLSSCLNNGNFVPGTDVLVIRRAQADDTLDTIAGSVDKRVYIQSIPNSIVVGLGGTGSGAFILKKKDGIAAAPLRRYIIRIYYVSPCNVPSSGTVCDAAADGGTPTPTLKRLELWEASPSGYSPTFSSPAFTNTALVEGIENVQYDLGIDNSPPVDGAPDGDYVTAPASIGDMSNVVSVKVNVLARDTEATPGVNDAKTYQLGRTTVGPLGGAFKRHAYSVVVRAINASGTRQ
jgi:type IV pilus assembly protein PilW